MSEKIQAGDIVKVSKRSIVQYKVLWINGFTCSIAEIKPDGSLYTGQAFDTSLLIKVDE